MFSACRRAALEKAKARVARDDPAVRAAFAQLLADAEKALAVKPPSVLKKPQTPPSGDRHDYMSQAPYFWPDPAKKDGLPYLRKDGQRNPESHDEHSDAPRMGRVGGSALPLALARYFTGKADYAEHAAKLLRVWYLDPATRMNPNFNFAQAVPGVNTGRGTGMIESRSSIPAMDAVGLLAGSPSWTKANADGMKTWMRAFLEWAQTSDNGKSEAAARNNHGSFYDEQIVSLALFLGRDDLAKQTLEAVKTKRIAVQIQPDGSQPLELDRADSFGYSRFNIEALAHLATLGAHAGVDLWHYETKDGAGLRQAIDFLLPLRRAAGKGVALRAREKERAQSRRRAVAGRRRVWRRALRAGRAEIARAGKDARVFVFPGEVTRCGRSRLPQVTRSAILRP